MSEELKSCPFCGFSGGCDTTFPHPIKKEGMTTQNWPNPERPGVPMFPEYVGEHILTELLSGKEVRARWNNEQSCWDVIALYEQAPKTVAQYFHYVRCKHVKLTPAQIAEMLAGERERCAKLCEDEYAKSGKDFEYLACNGIAAQIRNLGDAP